MARFQTPGVSVNYVRNTPNTVNLAGGLAHQQDAELELASLVTTSMVRDQFYRSADDGLSRLRELVREVDPYFAAQAAVYARNEDGIRSVTHAVAGEIAATVKGESWTKRFFDAVVRRPDDATEIVAYYLGNYGKPLPNSLKKGLGLALGKFDKYQLAKYRGEGNALSLVDVVNLVHPKPTEKNAAALKALVADKLRSEGTWETKLSAAGVSDDKDAAKADAWRELLTERKIGYFALLKNLRNIAEQAPELVPVACDLLVDEKLISGSLVLPFRYLTAYQELQAYPQILQALSNAIDVSLANVPDIGDAVIVLDCSGSMGTPVAGNLQLSCAGVGSLFAAALFKANQSDVVVFSSQARYVTGLNPADSTLTIAEKILGRADYGGTDFRSIFTTLKKKYETVVILSDMQAWIGHYTPAQQFAAYKQAYKASPKVFAFDLAGYGTAQFPDKDVFQLSGFSDKSLSLIEQFRTDPRALVSAIKAITF